MTIAEKNEALILTYAEEFASQSGQRECSCGNNGAGDCDWCIARRDWEMNDNEWRLDCNRDLMLLIATQLPDRAHSTDADCLVDPLTDLCFVCGVHHGDPCPICDGCGYHVAECARFE